MASTEVEVRDNRELRRVEALDEDGEVAGWAEYQIGLDGSTFDFTHTEVDERFEGQGIGTQLAAGVIEFVRGEGAKIVPSCSFIEHYMDKHEETQDLRAEPSTDEEAEDSSEDEESSESHSDNADQADSADSTDSTGSTGSTDDADQSDEQPRDESSKDTDDSSNDDSEGDSDADDESDDDSDDEDDSPESGPADAKAAGSGGAAEESKEEQP